MADQLDELFKSYTCASFEELYEKIQEFLKKYPNSDVIPADQPKLDLISFVVSEIIDGEGDMTFEELASEEVTSKTHIMLVEVPRSKCELYSKYFKNQKMRLKLADDIKNGMLKLPKYNTYTITYKQAVEIQRLINIGGLGEEDVDDLVNFGVDEEAVKLWIEMCS
jgi:hypothetical protein